jgi:F-type H+-transporting ATPase subunit b
MRVRELTARSFGAVTVLCTSLSAMAIASPAYAAGGEAPTTMDMLWQAFNLALLLGVIFYFARRPVQNFFSDRRDGIKSDIEKATELLRSAEARHSEWQGKITELEGELDDLRSSTRRRAEEERENIIAAALDTAERIKRDAVAAVDQELRRAHSELHEEAANLAVDLADRILRGQVDERDTDRLVDEFITRVEPATNGRPA